MDAFRNCLALLLVMVTPIVFVLWLSVHPFAGFWRRWGITVTLAVHSLVVVAMAAGIYLIRARVLAVDFGTYPLLILPAIPLGIAATALTRARGRQLGLRVLLGFPEVEPSQYPGRLVTAGIYSRVRHPRYAEVFLYLLTSAILANYLAGYLAVATYLAGLPVIVWVEEQELKQRFGGEYEQYARRVPRFIPKFR